MARVAASGAPGACYAPRVLRRRRRNSGGADRGGRRRGPGALVLALGLGALSPACVRVGAPGARPALGGAAPGGGPDDLASADSGEAADPPTQLRSAVQTRAAPDPDPAGPDWRDPGTAEVTVVFSAPLDPTSLESESFLLIDVDGRRWLPSRAVLAPCNEADELRCVTLSGAFGGGALARLQVIGGLVDASGHALRGQNAAVEPPNAAPRLVGWEMLAPEPGRCGGAAGALRLWWSRPVTPRPELAPAEAARVRTAAGAPLEILGLDDLELGEGPGAVPDHVIDLCLAPGGPAGEVEPRDAAFLAWPP